MLPLNFRKKEKNCCRKLPMWNFYVYIIFINIEPYLLIEIRNIVAKWVFEWSQSLATYCSNSYEIFHEKMLVKQKITI